MQMMQLPRYTRRTTISRRLQKKRLQALLARPELQALVLYLCRELVERHGGRIWFESIEGQGSTFFIALPIPSH